MKNLNLAIASDHAGWETKQKLIKHLINSEYNVKDFGTYSSDSADYADYAHILANSIENNEYDFGIALCGSGNGISMTLNKHQKIRAALCWNTEIAKLARQHNDANICSLPARFILVEDAKKIVDTFLNTGFEGGRHKIRIEKIPL